MFAIFHTPQPDGSLVATSESHPDWRLVTRGTLGESRERAEASLRAHVQSTLRFAHYEVPAWANDVLRIAA